MMAPIPSPTPIKPDDDPRKTEEQLGGTSRRFSFRQRQLNQVQGGQVEKQKARQATESHPRERKSCPEFIRRLSGIQFNFKPQILIQRCDNLVPHWAPPRLAPQPQPSSSSSAAHGQQNELKIYKHKSEPESKKALELVRQLRDKKVRMQVNLAPFFLRVLPPTHTPSENSEDRVIEKARQDRAARALRREKQRSLIQTDTTADENNNDAGVAVAGDGDGDNDEILMLVDGDGESRLDLNNNLAEKTTVSVTAVDNASSTSGYSTELSDAELPSPANDCETLQIVPDDDCQILQIFPDESDDDCELLQIVPASCSRTSTDELTDDLNNLEPHGCAEADAEIEAMIANMRRQDSELKDGPFELPIPPGAQANILEYDEIMGDITDTRGLKIDDHFWQLVLRGDPDPDGDGEGDMSSVATFEEDVASYFFQHSERLWPAPADQ